MKVDTQEMWNKASIEIYWDENTDRYYAEFNCQNNRGYNGLWQTSNPIPVDELNKIYQILEEHTDLETKADWITSLREAHGITK